jgi:hypothetical protein
MTKLLTLPLGLLLSLALASPVVAAPVASLKVGFSPNRPGSNTTVSFGFVIKTSANVVPPPLTELEVRIPAGMGLGTTDLGETLCTSNMLETQGVGGCSSNSYMGLGQALVEVPFGPEIIQEHVSLAILMAPAVEEHTTMLFLASGETPVAAEIIFRGQLLNDTGPYGARLDTKIPLTPSVPEAPDAAVVRMQSTLGPQGLTYFKTSKGQRIPFRPKGMVIPARCPHGGYQFAAKFTFQDGDTTSAHNAVPCTSRHHFHRHAK